MRRLIFLFLLSFPVLSPAQISYPQADSLSLAYYEQSEWNSLDSIGRLALDEGIDYPLLRMRIGYADYMLENYTASLAEYEAALKQDHGNTTARWFLYENNRLLGRDEAAAYHASFLPDSVLKKMNRKRNDVFSSADFLASGKFNSIAERSAAAYLQAGFSSRFGKRWSLYQSVAFYRQNYYLIHPDSAFHPLPGYPPQAPPPLRVDTTRIRQWQYDIRAGFQFSARWSAWTGTDFLFDGNGTQEVIGLGVKYERPKLVLSTDAYYGNFSSVHTLQLGGGFLLPVNNRFYVQARADYLSGDSINHFIPGFGFGFRLRESTWLSLNGTIGSGRYYSDNKGLYVYNMPDENQFRSTLSLSFPLSDHVRMGAYYTWEYQRNLSNSNYSQNSITGGLIWKR